jgi:uncharacterized protein
VGKVVSWIVLIALVVIGLKFVAIVKRKLSAAQRERPREPRPQAPVGELMRPCDRCGVHAPASEMLSARGRFYCCPEHRDADG